jgi:tetratricopeptide (TPR) repeat protein
MSEVATDPEHLISDLRQRLERTPRASRPLEHAALRYQLGLAYAELPTGERELNLSRAVHSYERAAELFPPDDHPVEHARVQNARGAALRELGSPQDAVAACERAVELLSGAAAPGELGAALNNLGLAKSDLGHHREAVEALERAIEAFDEAGEEHQRAMARHNLGQAQAAAEDHEAAAATYEEALAELDVEEAPYQWGMLQHALGVSLSAAGQPERAAEAFAASLRVFVRQRYPFQYALAKNNYGLAWAQAGGLVPLRRAVASYEDALRVFDPRMQRAQWEQTYRNLEMAESALAELGAEATRAQHFAALLGAIDDEPERTRLLRERLEAFFELPDKQRDDALAELSMAALGLDWDAQARFTASWLNVLMELPNDNLVQGLRARLTAHSAADAETAQTANEVLDRVIQEELLSPQRMRVRDTLEMLGWERP